MMRRALVAAALEWTSGVKDIFGNATVRTGFIMMDLVDRLIQNSDGFGR